jgi:N-methylhydantoinase A/oxoprolinase/acetone carboxylase beta subunit
VRSYPAPLDELDWARVNAILAEMVAEGAGTLAAAGVPRGALTVRRTADLRYRGQGHEVAVPIPDGELDAASLAVLEASFDAVYRSLYGRVAEGVALEAVSWRVVVSGPRPAIDLRARDEGSADVRAAVKGERSIYLPERHGYADVPIYDRYRLGPGATLAGPAIIEERESTTIIGGGRATIDEFRNLVVAMPVVQ